MYSFRKTKTGARRVLRDGQPTELYVHDAPDPNGYRFSLWTEGQLLGRFTSLGAVRAALHKRNL